MNARFAFPAFVTVPAGQAERFGLFELTHDAVIVRDAAGIVVYWNGAAESLYGWARSEALGKPLDALLGNLSALGHDALTAALWRDGHWEGERLHLHRGGRALVVASRQVVHRDAAHAAPVIVESIQDISERRQQADELRSSARLLQAVMDCTASYIHVRSRAGEFLYVNQEYERVFGVASADVIGNTIEEVFEPGIAAIRRAMHETVLSTAADLHDEIVQHQATGPRTYLDVKSPLFDEHGQIYAVYCIGTDITDRKASEARMLQLAHYDGITGLPNCALFLDRLEVAIGKARRTKRKMALLFLDLDRFKEVNDTLGHQSGDVLLAQAGTRIRECVRACDTVARMGGDEFTVIVEEIHAASDAAAIAEKIMAALAAPFRIGDDNIYISTSIGLTICPDDTADSTALQKNADHAMYLSKRLGGNHYSYFTPSMQAAAATRLRIATDLRSACQNQEFSLVYQPIVALGSGQAIKAEALLRWNHPVHGAISPADFIPISEETGLIVPIGDWVFREAARQCSIWRYEIDSDFQVSINTSPAQYRNHGIDMQGWRQHLARLALDGSAITVEITEGLLMDASDSAREQLRRYRACGMQVSLDDFGTGYSSLSYLRKFDVDFLKIDRSFVSHLTPGSDDLALCEAIIVMAHKLGIRVVAEGIETQVQHDLLFEAGCDYGQGYYFSRPLSAADFAARYAPPRQLTQARAALPVSGVPA